jgi:DeoR/GlpR family transcriptional regulator of sugar metabolism
MAHYSGFPRETVRRKINILVQKGWVTRDEGGAITATQRAKEELAPLTLTSLVYLTRMKATLAKT